MNLDSAVLYSNNIEQVIPFYRDILGFTFDYQTERFVSFLFPNGGRLGIKNKTEEREIPGHQTVFISVEKIEEKWQELKEKVPVYKELETKPWGKEFSILDPDHNKVLFVERP